MAETKYTKEYVAKLQKDAIAKLHRCGIYDCDDLVESACKLRYYGNVEILLDGPDNLTKSMVPETLFEV